MKKTLTILLLLLNFAVFSQTEVITSSRSQLIGIKTTFNEGCIYFNNTMSTGICWKDENVFLICDNTDVLRDYTGQLGYYPIRGTKGVKISTTIVKDGIYYIVLTDYNFLMSEIGYSFTNFSNNFAKDIPTKKNKTIIDFAVTWARL